jgi:hypothetical protein
MVAVSVHQNTVDVCLHAQGSPVNVDGRTQQCEKSSLCGKGDALMYNFSTPNVNAIGHMCLRLWRNHIEDLKTPFTHATTYFSPTIPRTVSIFSIDSQVHNCLALQ